MNNIKYNFKVALDPSVKNITSILSLTLGLVLTLVLFGNAMYERSYDSFYENNDRIYLLNDRGSNIWMPDIAMPTIKSEVPEIEHGTHFRSSSNTYTLNGDKFALTGLLVDSSFFDVLSFTVIKGIPRDDFKQHRILYLSESKAADLFGEVDPIGKYLVRDSSRVYTIKGIFKDIPKNSIISYQLGNDANELHFLEPIAQYGVREGWYAKGRNFAAVMLREDASKEQAQKTIRDVVNSKYDPEAAKERNQSINYILKPIDEVYIGYFGVEIMVMIISFMALLLVVVTALNYSLISVSSIASKLKEIAVRKCNGASSLSIVVMVVAQTAIQTLFATGLAILVISALRDPIEMFLAPIDVVFSVSNILRCIYIVVFVIIFSSIIPSKIFSGISVMSLFRSSRNSHQPWKKVMLFCQLFLSITIIILAVMGDRQYDYMFNKDAGYNYDNLVYTRTVIKDRGDYSKYRDELGRLDFVESVAFSSSNVMHDFGGFNIFEDGAKLFYARSFRTSENYFDVLQMEIIDGSSFRDGGDYRDVVVNERFVNMVKWDKETSAVGKTFVDADNKVHRVVGVVKDFETGYSAINSIHCNPIVIYPQVANQRFDLYTEITLRLNDISPGNIDDIVLAMNKLNPDVVDVNVDTYIDRRVYNYVDVKKPMTGITLSGVIIFLISIVGLYGYISNELQYRHREIALRKVYGASVLLVIKMIYRPIFILLCFAVPLGVIAGYFGGDLLLGSTLPYVVSMPWWVFVSVPLFVLLFTYFIVVARTYRIASENPVKAIHE